VEGLSAVFVAVDGWVDCRGRMDAWAGTMENGWEIQKLYYADKDKVDSTRRTPTRSTVRAAFNAGASLVVHTGHGHPDSWEKCFKVSDLDALSNSNAPAVVISAGCSTAYFAPLAPYDAYVDVSGVPQKGTDHGQIFSSPPASPAPYQEGKFNPTGLGEQFLKRNQSGAVVYIGCNTGSQPCALDLVEGFFSAASLKKELSIGECWATAIRYYHEKNKLAELKPTASWYPPSIFFQGMKFMFFGDPSLPFFAVSGGANN
jgi:hypothetical protein